jgi:hypothetical protein
METTSINMTNDETSDIGDLETLVAPAGGSDAVGGVLCAAGRAIIIIYTTSRER